MCGIFGRFTPGRRLADTGRFERATESLHHRGPDAGGCWSNGNLFLGHRRLSIIDLGSGQQPMASHDENFVIVYNGEVYNYLEIKEELSGHGAKFVTQSDTEVIIEAYRAWGPYSLSRLSGMFAFALYDRRKRTLFLARDRLGEKPLFYTEDGVGGVTFASELKALLAAEVVQPEIEPDALEQYLSLNYVPGTDTLLKNVKRLAPGRWRRYSAERGAESGIYWSPPDPISEPLPYQSIPDALPELRRRMDHGIKIALRSDVPVTLFLSGGIDSSLVAESAVRQGMIDTAYCLDFDEEGFSEWGQAKAVAQRLGLELRQAAVRVPDPDLFQRITNHADDPLADSSAVAVWHLCERTAKDFKVAITGDGGDELFGGYITYQATLLYAALNGVLPKAIASAICNVVQHLRTGDGKVTTSYKLQRFLRAFGLPPSLAHLTWNGTWLPEEAGTFMAPELRRTNGLQALSDVLRKHDIPHRPTLRHLQYLDALEYLPNDILAKVDRVSMAHGLETRAPFLSPEVAEFGLALPDRLKLQLRGKPKRVLRALADETFGPAISRAKKQGFSIPVHRWLRGPMRNSVDSFLGPSALAELPFLDADKVAAARDAHLAGQRQLGFELWGLMVLSAWWRNTTSKCQTARLGKPLEPLVLRELTE